MISSAVTRVTVPPRRAMITAPESVATLDSSPVPTSGDCGKSNGTDCRCMFDPISARLASSCSRNGISAAAIRDQLLRRHVHVVDARGASSG